ncbi:DUF2637 domain-containing protein [Pseudonocardia sp. RS010]|uniref:DUF2637 domain-containing protein n=1 Tax=Pseudonocardia sp. RS010 TaxID=3385979 RepID=UPI0039A3ADB2
MSARERWARTWPVLLAVSTVSAVGGPAAVASYRHARDVIARAGDPVMAPWLALTTDGMLVAALVVIWHRRHRGEAAGRGPWAAFWAGMVATIAANLAAAEPTVTGYVVALWPPVCLAITLELVALVAHRTARPGEGGTAEGHTAGAEIAVEPLALVASGEDMPADDLGEPDPARWWADAPPAGDQAGEPGVEVGEDRAAELIRSGLGRRRLAAELGIREHEARRLIEAHRAGVAA